MTLNTKHSFLFLLLTFGWWIILISAFPQALSSAGPEEKRLTIIHTNDLHSHLLGHSPNLDYTP